MDTKEFAELGKRVANQLDPRLVTTVERYLTAIPAVKKRLEQEYDSMLAKVEPATKPYRDRLPAFPTLPTEGRKREEVLQELQTMAQEEQTHWQDGHVSGAVYHGDPEHVAFLNQVYALSSQANPLHADLFPSVVKMEAEVVSMTAAMLGGRSGGTEEVCGTVSSGGTESILLAMKTYRDRARDQRGITAPELVVPTTAHTAFDKAAQFFGIKLVRVPVGKDLKADVSGMKAAVNRRTIVMVGSAPCFPYGVIDPIAELSEVARTRGIGFHTDACLGGFVLPFARKLGYPVPEFDFRLPGVTSMSADTHKFGYAAKGSSVVLYRGRALRSYQYYTVSDWPGGLYFSPGITGSRPGALSATAWAAMVTLGERGYLEASHRILETTAALRRGLAQIPELQLLGDALFMVAFTSSSLDIYRVLDRMSARHWNLNGLHRPPAVHLCVTLRHTAPGVVERFLKDLQDSVAEAKDTKAAHEGMAPMYGMAATLPLKGVISDLLKRYIDILYRV